MATNSAISKFNFLHLGYYHPPFPEASSGGVDIVPEANANWPITLASSNFEKTIAEGSLFAEIDVVVTGVGSDALMARMIS